MTDWRPTCSVEAARARASMLAALRHYFAANDVLEVQTPVLAGVPVSDRHIESLQVHGRHPPRTWFLQTSPEYPMKRLLAAGWPDCYQIASVCRDGEIGARHQPEFTLLEWYRLGFDLDALVDDAVRVIATAVTAAGGNAPAAVHRNTYDNWLRAAIDVDSDTPLGALEAMAGEEAAQAFAGDRDALLGYLFDARVVPRFAPGALTAVTHFPASQAALATLDDTGERALRAELYLDGLELANGFVELRDARTQRERFADDNRQRSQAGQVTHAPDEQLLAALESGLPPCAGMAIGLDRLLMAALGAPTIDAVVSFAHAPLEPSDD